MPSPNLLEYAISNPPTNSTFPNGNNTLDVRDEAFNQQSIMPRGTASPGLVRGASTARSARAANGTMRNVLDGQGHVHDESYTKQRQESNARLVQNDVPPADSSEKSK
ncbi:hypothetical protein GYMLUDRAFT_62306 [Collybiopsis luxurians FD-317 M1]|uniref:Uncharacterized protein n=1 Tax=Collybiopsis luxurians FD-317 M1 TaxID=944289 RepID=A0A0D0C0J8_9AGAR|nr:hypothetical protein GYMLUDRAFT_62306 [Collybiopsis luxurians FD-317 M1]